MFDYLKLSLLAAVVLLAVYPIAGLLARRFNAGMFCIFSAIYVKAFFASIEGVEGKITIYPMDVVFLLLAISTFIRIFFVTGPKKKYLLWLGFGAFLLISFIAGYLQFGLSAGVAYRTYFYAFVTALYIASFALNEKRIDFIINSWFVFTSLLFVSVLFRWIADPAALGLSWLSGNYEEGFRVIPSNMALMMAQSVMLALLLQARGTLPKIWRVMIPLWLVAVVVLQHRSTWLAALAGFMAAFYLTGHYAAMKRMTAYLAMSVLVIAIGMAALSFAGVIDIPGLFDSLITSAETGVKLETTAAERLYGWWLLLHMWLDGGGQVWFFGFPFGTEFIRDVSQVFSAARDIGYQAHNFYVQTLLNAGLIGLALLLVTYFVTMKSLYRKSSAVQHPVFTGRFLFLLLVMQLVYYVAYGVEFPQAIWLGMGISLAAISSASQRKGIKSEEVSSNFCLTTPSCRVDESSRNSV